ncbi:phenylacetate--CoA ligase family protein [Microbacterium sp. NIBRBAC000506063]|uniref:phenylacetate--CoA ligase family protein n=1 Tax=Microbacterium sp. NIBRBAC000506063 TaxID=2734618 RepID=UPI001BB4E818|nr:hypothetical protein [Microbacterium sp. NIBRBAC000506063]QTV80205.1 phenylacetate--CoA ligase family protein [Microbacterium sp. NIBRBAC000506063]
MITSRPTVKQRIFAMKSRLLMRADRAALRDMLAAERLEPGRARELRDRRSARIARHAFDNFDFYRDKYGAAGFTAADLEDPRNFDALPRLTKDEIADYAASVDGTARDRLPSRTGGSTGRPLLVYNDRQAPVAALWWRIYSWWGVHPGDDAAFIYRQSRTGAKRLLYDLEWWPTRHLLLDARGTTPEARERFVRQVRRTRPALLVGYVEAAYDFAASIAPSEPLRGLTAVSVTASMLQAGQREFIESRLGAPVFDTYRSAEVPWIAAECAAQDGLHVLSDRRRVDIVGAGDRMLAPGQVGDVLVTDLDNRAFPLVRYAIGDRSSVIEGACACGRSLDRITALDGRIADVLRSPSGLVVSGGLGGIFNQWSRTVTSFQIRQGNDYHVDLLYVSRPGEDGAEAASTVARMLEGFLGNEVPVTPVAVESIEAVGGKARLVISDVEPPPAAKRR